MSKETELSDEQIDCCVGNLGMAENSILAGPDEIRRAMRAAIAADRELRLGDVMMPVIAYAYDDPEYGFAGSPCKRFSGTPPGRAQNSEALVRLSDARAVLAAKRELAEELAALTAERDELRKDEDRLVWAMDRMGMGTTSIDFLASVLRRGGTGDLGDCRTFIDEAIAKEKAQLMAFDDAQEPPVAQPSPVAVERKPLTDSRTTFEKWAKNLDMDVFRNPLGYSDCNTDYAWLAWNEGQAHGITAQQGGGA